MEQCALLIEAGTVTGADKSIGGWFDGTAQMRTGCAQSQKPMACMQHDGLRLGDRSARAKGIIFRRAKIKFSWPGRITLIIQEVDQGAQAQ